MPLVHNDCSSTIGTNEAAEHTTVTSLPQDPHDSAPGAAMDFAPAPASSSSSAASSSLRKGDDNDVHVSVIESGMKSMSISCFPNSKHKKTPQWHQVRQDHKDSSQIINSTHNGSGANQFLPLKFSTGLHPILQSSGFTPPLFATTAYVASPNPFFSNAQDQGLYSSQYAGAYTLNSTLVPPHFAGYAPHGSIPMIVDGPVGLNHNTPTHPCFTVPAHIQYCQQFHALRLPFNISTSIGGVTVNQTTTRSLEKIPHAFDDQKLEHLVNGMANQNLSSGLMINPQYVMNPPNVGIFMPFSSAPPYASPVFPGSPAAGMAVSGGRNDERFLSGTGRCVTAAYSGWQEQKGFGNSHHAKLHNFLEELKSGKGRRFELSDIAGHIVEFSADQHGSRFIQQKLENCSEEDKVSVFREVLPHASKLMTDVFGNYVVQKFLEYGSFEQRKELASQLTGQILPLSLQMYGCRVIQKALEVIELDQKAELIQELDGHVMRCVRDQNGNHVIQKCIESVPTHKIGFIISSFRGQVPTLSTHPYGCRVVQRVLEHCTGNTQCQFIIDEILESVCILAQDQYGNYVTQHVLERGKPQERRQIINKLSGRIVQMSQHKFASNVVEKCLEYGGPTERDLIIEETLGQTEGNDNLLVMMKDQFANYVVQKILETCTNTQRAMLLLHIRTHSHALKKYTYGKHIVARFEQQFGQDAKT